MPNTIISHYFLDNLLEINYSANLCINVKLA